MSRFSEYPLWPVALLLLAACTKAPAPSGTVPSADPLEFRLAEPSVTRGAQAVTSLEQLWEQDFGLSAWYTPEGETFDVPGGTSVPYILNHRFGCLEGSPYTIWRGIARDGATMTHDPVYYPLDGTLTFFCYAPYRSDMGPGGDIEIVTSPDPAVTGGMTDYLVGSPLIRFSPNSDPSRHFDFLASTPVLDVKRPTPEAPIYLDFTRHLTTRVEFWVNYKGTLLNTYERVMVKQIVIKGVVNSEYLYFTESPSRVLGFGWCTDVSPADGSSNMPKGDYILSWGGESLDDEKSHSLPDYGVDPTEFNLVNNRLNGLLYLLPQAIPTGAELEITYIIYGSASDSAKLQDEIVVTRSLSGTPDWPEGKTVRYYITLDVPNRGILGLNASIVDWVDSGNDSGTLELLHPEP